MTNKNNVKLGDNTFIYFIFISFMLKNEDKIPFLHAWMRHATANARLRQWLLTHTTTQNTTLADGRPRQTQEWQTFYDSMTVDDILRQEVVRRGVKPSGEKWRN